MNHDMGQSEDRTQHEDAYSDSGTSPPRVPTELIARRYHAHRLIPIPLDPFTKKPTITGWADATTRPAFDQLLPRWGTEGAGIGLVTGRSAGIIVVDVDPRNGGDPRPFLGTTDAVARTAHDGWHFFYRYDGEGIAGHRGVLPGVDLKGDGGQVVVWPSRVRRNDGKLGTYRWGADEKFDGSALAALLGGKLPGFSTVAGLLGLRANGHNPSALRGPAGGGSEGWLAVALLGVPQGQRNETAAKLAGYLLKKHPPDVALGLLRIWNRQNRRPLSDDELAAVFASIAKKDEAAQHRAKFRTYTAAELVAAADAQIETACLVEGWLPEGAIGLIAGPSHAGKTWVLADLAMSVATGKPFLGQHQVVQGPVLFVAAEDNKETLGERVRAACLAKIAPVDLALPDSLDGATEMEIEPLPPVPDLPFLATDERRLLLGDQPSEAAFRELVLAFRPRLLIIDPLKDVVKGKMIRDFFATISEHLPYLRGLQREVLERAGYPLTIVIAHHVGKDQDRAGTDNAIIGGTLFIGSADTRWVIEKVRDGMVVSPSIKRLPPTGKHLWRYDLFAGRLCWTTSPVGQREIDDLKSQNDKDEAIVRALRETGQIGFNGLLRAVELHGAKMAKQTLLNHLDGLRKRGIVAQTAAKKWKLVRGPQGGRPR